MIVAVISVHLSSWTQPTGEFSVIQKSFIAASASTLMLFGVSQANAADLYEPALPDLSAVMSMYGGGAFFDTFGGTTEDGAFDGNSHWLMGGDARVAGRSWQLEINTQVLGATDTESGDASEFSAYGAFGGHWLNRSDNNTWGIFTGVAAAQHQDSASDTVNWFGGVEYASFHGNSTWFGQFGGTMAIAGDVSDGWEYGLFGRAGYRHFFADNTKLEVDGMLGWGMFDGGLSASTCSLSSFDCGEGLIGAWGVELEHQFSAPFSGFIAYRGDYVQDSDHFRFGDDNEIVSHAIVAGFRVDVNTMSLIERDRVGAGTFDLPDFHRAMAWPDDLD